MFNFSRDGAFEYNSISNTIHHLFVLSRNDNGLSKDDVTLEYFKTLDKQEHSNIIATS